MAKKDAGKKTGGDGKGSKPLKGAVKKTKRSAHGLEITIRLQNPGGRALQLHIRHTGDQVRYCHRAS